MKYEASTPIGRWREAMQTEAVEHAERIRRRKSMSDPGWYPFATPEEIATAEENARERSIVQQRLDAALEELQRLRANAGIVTAEGKTDAVKIQWVCDRCGSPDVEGTFWCKLNTLEHSGDTASDEYWCPVCDDHVGVDHVSDT